MSVKWVLANVRYRSVPSGMVTDTAVVVPLTFSGEDKVGEPGVIRNFTALYLISPPQSYEPRSQYYAFANQVPTDVELRLSRMDLARDLLTSVMPYREVSAPSDLLFGGNMVLSMNGSKDGENTP